MASSAAWTELTGILREIEALEGALAVLGWDQQTMMPRKGSAARGAQLAALSKIVHERLVSPRVGELIAELDGSDLDQAQTAGLRNLKRSYLRATRVSSDLVVRIAEAQSEAFDAWIFAKTNNDFASYVPSLSKLFDLVLERVRAIDDTRHPYDVMLEEFDPGTTIDTLKPMFARLQSGLVELLKAISQVSTPAPLAHEFDVVKQRDVHNTVLRAMGFDFDAGRLDDSEHPFSVGIHPDDVRITTHIYPNDFLSSLSGTIHEGGHALYEQGLPQNLRGMMVSHAASFGLHESQSRFWENTIGRSQPFSTWLSTRLDERFPGNGVDGATLYRAANRVSPGLIRIKADEVTYNLHIIVRFEIEVALFEGKLAIADLPAAWNAKYKEYLGVDVPNDADGVLQDVHWSGGAFAYFPSYTLGNLYAAGLGATLTQQMPDLWDRVAAGDFAPIREWLRTNIHEKGHLEEAPEIVRGVIGDRDLVADFLNYLWARHGALHGVTRG